MFVILFTNTQCELSNVTSATLKLQIDEKKTPLRTKIETHEYWFYFNKFKLNLIQARKKNG